MSSQRGVVCFSHGQEGGPDGTKIRVLTPLAEQAGWRVESLDYRGIDDPAERIEKLFTWCMQQPTPVLLVGSSMGAAVSAAVAHRIAVTGLFLMATAIYVPGYEAFNPLPLRCQATLVHGWRDEVIPYRNGLRFALECRGRFTLLAGDHGLGDADSLERLKALFQQFLASHGKG